MKTRVNNNLERNRLEEGTIKWHIERERAWISILNLEKGSMVMVMWTTWLTVSGA